jgi:hypothetical protein
MKSPDFYIVGAPKCGTTAFDEYLNQHPKISMTEKELHYWGSDIVFREGKISEETYFKHLQKSFKQGKLLGEGAVWYLVSTTAAQELKQFSPNAKILIFLRNPVEACYSLYYNTHFNGDDVSPSFEDALANQELRKTQLPEFYNCPTIAFQYQSVYLYYEQVKHYIDVFGKENVKVVVFEEFLKNKHAVYNDVLVFLGVQPHDLDFKPINQNKEIRSVGLRQFITQPKPFVKGIFKTLIPHKPWREKIKVLLWDVNAKEVQRPSMLPETKQKLQQFFAQDIQRLEQFVDKDLGCWR